MELYSGQINKLIEELAALPGIGSKSAQRLAFHLINNATIFPESWPVELSGKTGTAEEDRTRANHGLFIGFSHYDKDSKLRNTVVITNPLGEDTSVMRTSLLPSMCEIMASNYNNRNASVCLFEMGNEYLPKGGELPEEPARMCFGMPQILTRYVLDTIKTKQ